MDPNPRSKHLETTLVNRERMEIDVVGKSVFLLLVKTATEIPWSFLIDIVALCRMHSKHSIEFFPLVGSADAWRMTRSDISCEIHEVTRESLNLISVPEV